MSDGFSSDMGFCIAPCIPHPSLIASRGRTIQEQPAHMLDANRLFPAEPAARAIARKLYASIGDLPIISPHGHTDPRWFADNQPFPNPFALFIQPDHYIFRMLYSQGVSLESLGIPQVDGKQAADPREVWRIFAKHY